MNMVWKYTATFISFTLSAHVKLWGSLRLIITANISFVSTSLCFRYTSDTIVLVINVLMPPSCW